MAHKRSVLKERRILQTVPGRGRDGTSAGRIVGLRGIGPSLAEEALRRIGFRALRGGFLVFASKARFGPIPLRWRWLVLSRPGQGLQGAAMDGIIWTAESEERR